MLTTTIPASTARRVTPTSALESAGASTIACDAPRDHLLDQRDLTRDVLFVLDAGRDQFVLLGVSGLVRRAPSSIVLKNSLASDFITSATTGRPGALRSPRLHPASRRQQ